MGFRTVVVLSNDYVHEWGHDPYLGSKIFLAAGTRDLAAGQNFSPYGEIVEQVHADTQTVAFLDGCGGEAMVREHWRCNEDDGAKNLRLLKALADKLGYSVRRKNKPASRR